MQHQRQISPKFHLAVGAEIKKHYELDQTYYDLISEIKTYDCLESIDKTIATICYQYGFQYYSLVASINQQSEGKNIFSVARGDMEYLMHYRENKYFFCDPMIRLARETCSPFVWNAQDYNKKIKNNILRNERNVIEYSIDFGIKQSFTFPFGIPGRAGGLLRLNRLSANPMGPAEAFDVMSRLTLLCGVINQKYCDLLHPNDKSTKDILTKKEIDIIRYSSCGMTAKEIAKELFISNHTVSTHIKNIRNKLDVKNIAHAVKKSIDSGIIIT